MNLAIDFLDRCVNVAAPLLFLGLIFGCVVLLIIGEDPQDPDLP